MSSVEPRESILMHVASLFSPVLLTAAQAAELLEWDAGDCEKIMRAAWRKGRDHAAAAPPLEPGWAGPLREYAELRGRDEFLEAARVLLPLMSRLAAGYRSQAVRAVCERLLRDLLAFRCAGADVILWRDVVTLCLKAHPFTLPFQELGKPASLVLYKARGLAFATGDMRALASLDVIIGSEATRCGVKWKRFVFRTAGQRGKQALASFQDWDLRTALALYLGILDFDQGHYQNAVGHLSLCPRHEGAAPAQAVMAEIGQHYHAHAASLLGDFDLATSLLRSSLRLVSAGTGHVSLDMLKLQLAFCLLAQGETEEPLELIDSVISCASTVRNLPLWSCACVTLAYYHRMTGNPDKGHRVFANGMCGRERDNYAYFAYNTPFFLELLYAWHEAGLPAIEGCGFEVELERRLRGHNEMLKAVALRLKAQILLREKGGPARAEGLRALESSLAIARQIGAARERAKACVVMAQAHLQDGRRQAGLALAMEAWSLSHMLRQDPWMQMLAEMVPAPSEKGRSGTRSPVSPSGGEAFCDAFSRALMEEQPETARSFHRFILETVRRQFGASRACLLRLQENGGRLIFLAGHGMGEADVTGRAFLPQAALVEKALAGDPLFTAIGGAGAPLAVICLPLPGRDGERLALYMDGDIFPQLANILTAETLRNLSRILAWEFVRLERRRPARVSSGKQDGPAACPDAPILVHESAAMRDFLVLADSAAPSDAAITLYGETGTGKELVARRIHEASGRPGPFVAVNLSSMPEELFENEMLGHERGAFTGALQRKSGLVELADKGTLFIDEMPDVSQRVQVKLLRLLQEKSFSRLGGTVQIHSDFRLVVATNRDIRRDVSEGRFREDLFYRINVVPLVLPPLRERPDDILPIASHYLELFNRRYGKNCRLPGSGPSLDALRAHAWPGNVRELRNLVEQAVIRSTNRDGVILLRPYVPDLGAKADPRPSALSVAGAADLARQEKAGAPAGVFFSIPNPSPRAGIRAEDMLAAYYAQLPSLKQVEQGYIQAVMELTGGKVDGRLGAARILGLKRSSLYYRLDRKKRKAAADDGG